MSTRHKPGTELIEAARAVADFLSGPKDRFGRIDAGANEAVRDARERVRVLAVRYNVTGSHTQIDQCAAVLRAAIAKVRPTKNIYRVMDQDARTYAVRAHTEQEAVAIAKRNHGAKSATVIETL